MAATPSPPSSSSTSASSLYTRLNLVVDDTPYAKPLKASATPASLVAADNSLNTYIDYENWQSLKPNSYLDLEDSLLMTFSKYTTSDFPVSKTDFSKTTKSRIREGVSEFYRPHVWQASCGLIDYVADPEGYYAEALERVFRDDIPETVLAFPTFAGDMRDVSSSLCLTPAGHHALRRVLCVIANENPDITFCHSLPTLVALFLHFVREDIAYGLAHCVLEASRTFKTYLNLSKDETTVWLQTFESLIGKKLPKVKKVMDRLQVPIETFALDWFETLFVGVLPIQTAMRFFDCFMYEGSKILLRVGLAILETFQDMLATCRSTDDFVDVITTIPATCSDYAALAKKAFDFSLSKAEVTKFNRKHRGSISSMDETRFNLSTLYYHPKVTPKSEALSSQHLSAIWSWLPTRYRIRDARRIFTSSVNGYNLKTMCDICRGSFPLIILIKVNDNLAFGVYLSVEMVVSETYYGTRETFVFQAIPNIQKCGWMANSNDMIVRYPGNEIQFGGGNAVALTLKNDFSGTSYPCETFGNPTLCGVAHNFMATCVEVYVFD